jgi:hypothetical protein
MSKFVIPFLVFCSSFIASYKLTCIVGDLLIARIANNYIDEESDDYGN